MLILWSTDTAVDSEVLLLWTVLEQFSYVPEAQACVVADMHLDQTVHTNLHQCTKPQARA